MQSTVADFSDQDNIFFMVIIWTNRPHHEGIVSMFNFSGWNAIEKRWSIGLQLGVVMEAKEISKDETVWYGEKRRYRFWGNGSRGGLSLLEYSWTRRWRVGVLRAIIRRNRDEDNGKQESYRRVLAAPLRTFTYSSSERYTLRWSRFELYSNYLFIVEFVSSSRGITKFPVIHLPIYIVRSRISRWMSFSSYSVMNDFIINFSCSRYFYFTDYRNVILYTRREKNIKNNFGIVVPWSHVTL